MNDQVLLGLDGGGTYTRAAITDTEGNLRSYVELKGGAFLQRDANAKENVFNAVQAAVQRANCKLHHIVGVTAGIAGYDHESDLVWVRELTNMDGLPCKPQHVNDAIIAHKGALLTKPGIIAISGTGSNIFGITEKGRLIRNYDFYYYANTAARYLSYNGVYKILAGETDHSDHDLVDKVLKHFGVNDLSALIELGSKGFIESRSQRDRRFGDLAPVITDAALQGSHLAESICHQAAKDIVTGIRLIGACFESESIATALIGSVANSIFIKNTIYKICDKINQKRYVLMEPALPAVLGAVIMAMQTNGISINERMLRNLHKSAETIAKSV